MPVVVCPIEDCDYKTPDLEASIVTVLIDAHCRNHDKSSAMSNESRITIQSGKPTLQDINRNLDVKGLVIGLILCSVALLLDLALSFSPHYWFKMEETFLSVTTKATVGLWRGCVVTEDDKRKTERKCWDHDDKEFPFNYMFVGAAQVFQCLGVIFLMFAIIGIIIKLTICKEKDIIRCIAGLHAIWAAVFFIGSAGAFGTGLKKINTPTDDYTENLHFSFAFAVICGFVALLGAVALLVAAKTTSKPSNKKNLESTDS